MAPCVRERGHEQGAHFNGELCLIRAFLTIDAPSPHSVTS